MGMPPEPSGEEDVVGVSRLSRSGHVQVREHGRKRGREEKTVKRKISSKSSILYLLAMVALRLLSC